jgi:hypothetical protein
MEKQQKEAINVEVVGLFSMADITIVWIVQNVKTLSKVTINRG